MEFLSSGVLQKLCREMGTRKTLIENQKPFLLQIRSIIPISTEGDLWPNKGFCLKVSDSSHSLFVSLPHEQDEMVLCNKLQLGQLLCVDELVPSHPYPMLRGIKPVPGRFACLGNPQDLVSVDKLVDLNPLSGSVLKTETKDCVQIKQLERFGSSSASKIQKSRDPDVQERGSNFLDIPVCNSSSSLSKTAKRRSWVGRENLDANLVKQGVRPHSRSSSDFSLCSRKNDGSEGNLNSQRKIKHTSSVAKPSRSSTKNKPLVPAKSCEKNIDPASIRNSVSNKKTEETKNLWNSLPPILAKHGKEVFRLKEAAMLAAVDVLQEASAADRLLECLRTYSELQLAKADNQYSSFDKFFKLQEDMARTLLLVDSLNSINPPRDNYVDPSSPGSVCEALKLASERKKNATSWIKAAVASDLNPVYSSDADFMQATMNTTKNSSTNLSLKPEGTSLVKMQGKNGTEYSLPDWVKGSTVDAASKLGSTLQDECKKWFLAHVESYLDEIRSKIISESDHEVAEMMRQMKKVNNWLDMLVEHKDGTMSGDSELDLAYGRVRDKIYGVLLQNVERTAVALEHRNAMEES